MTGFFLGREERERENLKRKEEEEERIEEKNRSSLESSERDVLLLIIRVSPLTSKGRDVAAAGNYPTKKDKR